MIMEHNWQNEKISDWIFCDRCINCEALIIACDDGPEFGVNATFYLNKNSAGIYHDAIEKARLFKSCGEVIMENIIK